MIYQESQRFNPFISVLSLFHISNCLLVFARKRKPTGLKKERQRGKLPNQIRHDLNASIAVGTWTNKGIRNSHEKK